MKSFLARFGTCGVFLFSLLAGCVPDSREARPYFRPLPLPPDATRPLVAIWLDRESVISEAPYLRIAIWNDGRVVFAQNPEKWSHDLRAGRIDENKLTELKQAIKATGLFDLKRDAYLVPDAPVYCMLVDLGDSQTVLYWDEMEIPNYGIGTSTNPEHVKFRSCWKEINRLALSAIPQQSELHQERFQRPPRSWELQAPIQSK